MRVAALIVAAGRGTRAGLGLPKQWRALAGADATTHAVSAFEHHPAVDKIALVLNSEDILNRRWQGDPDVIVVTGGVTRSASVRAGLEALADHCDVVLIHDAARPCVAREVIDGVLAALRTGPAAAPAVPVVDALWHGADGHVSGLTSRDGLFRAQTPQGFDINIVLAAHLEFADAADDDVALVLRARHPVKITEGSEDNLKITLPADFARAERILKGR